MNILIADAFHSKKSTTALLAYNSKHYKSDAVQGAIHLLVVATREIYMRTQAVCAKRSFSYLFHLTKNNPI